MKSVLFSQVIREGMRQWQLKQFAQGHAASKWQSLDLTPASLDSIIVLVWNYNSRFSFLQMNVECFPHGGQLPLLETSSFLLSFPTLALPLQQVANILSLLRAEHQTHSASSLWASPQESKPRTRPFDKSYNLSLSPLICKTGICKPISWKCYED